MNWEFLTGCVCAVLAFGMISLGVSSCEPRMEAMMNERFMTCVQGGGTWVPTEHRRGACISSLR